MISPDQAQAQGVSQWSLERGADWCDQTANSTSRRDARRAEWLRVNALHLRAVATALDERAAREMADPAEGSMAQPMQQQAEAPPTESDRRAQAALQSDAQP